MSPPSEPLDLSGIACVFVPSPRQKVRLREVGEGSVEVGVEILWVFETDAEPDHAIADTNERSALGPDTAVRGGWPGVWPGF